MVRYARWMLGGSGLALIAFVGCGPRGLPDAGPGPGEVDVGYDTQDADKTTGAVKTIREGETGKARPLRIDEILRGRIAGLVISRGEGGRPVYRLRGTDSLLNSQEPLFVIDGVPTSARGVEAALAGLLPDDIRQVDVLKDVASTSIYGTRGAGGVILITTRR